MVYSDERLLSDETVSPELALVDPELARRARARLPDPGEKRGLARVFVEVERTPAPTRSTQSDEVERTPAPTRSPQSETSIRRTRSRGRQRLGVIAAGASVLAAILVVADVQVEVGRTPAAANIFAVVEEPSGPTPALSARAPKPAFPAAAPKPNHFTWAPAADATEYHFELFRGETRIFAADTVGPALAVPARWTFGGRTRTLEPGSYSWYVWPVVSGRAGDAIVDAVLPVPG